MNMQINSAFQFQTLNNFDMFMYVMGFIKISIKILYKKQNVNYIVE
jgi:hypothetical protein